MSALASARDVAALPRAAAPAPAAASEHFDKRRLVAFIFMVFGMFMAILDIQIVSASLSEIQAGLSVVATVHTRDPALPKPTILSALGLDASASRSLKP